MAKDPNYDFWEASLAWKAAGAKGEPPDFDKHHVPSGFWRGRFNSAIASWRRGDGSFMARVHRPNRSGGGLEPPRDWTKEDLFSEQVFSTCCRNPLTHEAYQAFVKSGVWPEDVKTTTPRREGSREYYAEDRADAEQARSINEMPQETESGTRQDDQSRNDSASSDDPPEVAIRKEIDALIADAEAWFGTINRQITEKLHADRVANFSLAAAELEARAEAARVAEKRPIDAQAAAIQARWVPVRDRAAKTKTNLKTLLGPWLNAQKKKAAEEAAAARKVREEAQEKGEQPPARLPQAYVNPSVAGTQGRVSLRTRQVYRLVDLKAAAVFLAELNDQPEPFVTGVLTSAERLIKAGMTVPGVSVETEDVVG